MTKLELDFEPGSWSSWKEKMEADLKGKAINSMEYVISEGINLPLALHPDQNVEAGEIRVRKSFPAVCEALSPANNESILASLNAGVNAVVVNDPLETKQWAQIMEEVDLGFVEIHLLQPDALTSFFEFASEKGFSNIQGVHWETNSAVQLNNFLKHGDHIPEWKFFNYNLSNTNPDPIKRVFSFLEWANFVFEDLDEENVKEKAVEKFALWFPLSLDFLKDIMAIRAVKLVWGLLLDAWKLDAKTPLYIMCSTDGIEPGKISHEKNMIRNTSMASAATIAGVDALWVRPGSEVQEDQDFAKRIARNVLHLFEQEGKMGLVKDPIAGAYYFENGANAIAKEAWDLFRAQ